MDQRHSWRGIVDVAAHRLALLDEETNEQHDVRDIFVGFGDVANVHEERTHVGAGQYSSRLVFADSDKDDAHVPGLGSLLAYLDQLHPPAAPIYNLADHRRFITIQNFEAPLFRRVVRNVVATPTKRARPTLAYDTHAVTFTKRIRQTRVIRERVVEESSPSRRGRQGTQGPPGERGARGEQGEQGERGARGERGRTLVPSPAYGELVRKPRPQRQRRTLLLEAPAAGLALPARGARKQTVVHISHPPRHTHFDFSSYYCRRAKSTKAARAIIPEFPPIVFARRTAQAQPTHEKTKITRNIFSENCFFILRRARDIPKYEIPKIKNTRAIIPEIPSPVFARRARAEMPFQPSRTHARIPEYLTNIFFVRNIRITAREIPKKNHARGNSGQYFYLSTRARSENNTRANSGNSPNNIFATRAHHDGNYAGKSEKNTRAYSGNYPPADNNAALVDGSFREGACHKRCTLPSRTR